MGMVDLPVIDRLPRRRGTYILLCELGENRDLRVGRRLRYRFMAGGYAYVGSARGPGGLAARVGRHAASGKRRHWHIDFLLPPARLVGVLLHPIGGWGEEGEAPFLPHETRGKGAQEECRFAAWVAGSGATVVPRFGASDCRCPGHLFRVDATPPWEGWLERAIPSLDLRFLPASALSGQCAAGITASG